MEIDGILADAQRLGTFYNAVFQFEKPLAVEPRDDLLVLVGASIVDELDVYGNIP